MGFYMFVANLRILTNGDNLAIQGGVGKMSYLILSAQKIGKGLFLMNVHYSSDA